MENMKELGTTRGDLIIVLGENHVLKAHAEILRENCTNLVALLAEEKVANLTAKARVESGLRWRIDLVHGEGVCKFENKQISEHGFTSPVAKTGIAETPGLVDALADTIGLAYSITPDYGKTLRSALDKTLFMLVAGSVLGAMPMVRVNAEKAILDKTDNLWEHIANAPAEWLILGMFLESKLIFKEALIHTIGKWKLLTPDQRTRIGQDPILCNVVLCKLVAMWQAKKKSELGMLGYHPEVLKEVVSNARAMAGPAPGRGVYSNHIFTWIGLCLFRQWLGQMIAEGASFRAGDGGYTLYKAMSRGGDAYLKRSEINNFYGIFPMSEKAKGIIEDAINIIKDGVKQYVEPHVKENANYKDVEYLISCEVVEGDHPWIKTVDEEELNAAKSFVARYPEFGIWAPRTSTTPLLGRITVKDLVSDNYLANKFNPVNKPGADERRQAAAEALASLANGEELPEANLEGVSMPNAADIRAAEADLEGAMVTGKSKSRLKRAAGTANGIADGASATKKARFTKARKPANQDNQSAEETPPAKVPKKRTAKAKTTTKSSKITVQENESSDSISTRSKGPKVQRKQPTRATKTAKAVNSKEMVSSSDDESDDSSDDTIALINEVHAGMNDEK